MSFFKLGINGDLVYALDCLNIIEPTPIQTLSIPRILNGEDIIAEAQTGTGKTFAFLLPMFQNFDKENKNIQGLVVAPTRELALQITEVAMSLSSISSTNILACYGGQDVKAQLHKLQGEVQLVIGTPGRILDHIRRGTIDFKDLKTFVVDEADQLFHIGFSEEINSIIAQLPTERQTLCFSATINKNVNKFAYRYLNHPTSVKAPKKQITLDNIKQTVLETSNRRKFDDFLKLLKTNVPEKAIIFCRSRIGTQTLYEGMKELGYNVDCIHGALTQAKRESVMSDFKENNIQYLVATDVASRGLDVNGVTHVFNYNLPDEAESYVHRIGRTGRAGNFGVSYTIITLKDEKRLEAIEDFIKMKIDRIRYSDDLIKKEKTVTKQNVSEKTKAIKKQVKVNTTKHKSKPAHKKKQAKRKKQKSRIR